MKAIHTSTNSSGLYRLGTSPELRMLLISSRKDSSTIWVSLNRKTVGLLSTPAKRYSFLMSRSHTHTQTHAHLKSLTVLVKILNLCNADIHEFPNIIKLACLVLALTNCSFSKVCECNGCVADLTLSKLQFAVLLGDFHLEYLVLTYEGSYLRQASPT